MLSCRELSLKASEYLDGQVPLWTRMEIRLHIVLCERCRRYLRQLRTVVGALNLYEKADSAEHAVEEETVRKLIASFPRRQSDATANVSAQEEVEIYTTAWCGYCRRAKALLDRKGVPYREIRVDRDAAKRAEMVARAGGRTTVPQIFIDGRPVGGSDELHALESSGELDRLLRRT